MYNEKCLVQKLKGQKFTGITWRSSRRNRYGDSSLKRKHFHCEAISASRVQIAERKVLENRYIRRLLIIRWRGDSIRPAASRSVVYVFPDGKTNKTREQTMRGIETSGRQQLIHHWRDDRTNFSVYILKTADPVARNRLASRDAGYGAQSKMKKENDKEIRNGESVRVQRRQSLNLQVTNTIAVSRVSETKWPSVGMNMNEPSGWYSEARNKIISFSVARLRSLSLRPVFLSCPPTNDREK